MSPPPNPNDFSAAPGSGVPGGGAPGGTPPELGYPPGIFPNGSWDTILRQTTEFEIQAAVGPTLRARHYFKESLLTTTSHQADWNGARSNSSISSGSPVGTYELEGEFVSPMVARSPQNSAVTISEAALYLVRVLSRKTQSTPFTVPYPFDGQNDTLTVYYQQAGGMPVAIAGDIEALFPAIAWQDPDQYLWSRNATLQDGVLYLYPPPAPGTDFRNSNATISLQAYRVDDGSLSEITRQTR